MPNIPPTQEGEEGMHLFPIFTVGTGTPLPEIVYSSSMERSTVHIHGGGLNTVHLREIEVSSADLMNGDGK